MGGSGRVLVGTDHGGVDPDIPAFDAGIAAPLQLAQQPFPGPVAGPTPVPVVDGLPRPVPAWQIPPARPRTSTPQHGVHHRAVISPRPARLTHARPRKMGLEQVPLLIGQIMTIMHIRILDQTSREPLQDTP